MTAREQVLAAYPDAEADAIAFLSFSMFGILRESTQDFIGSGRTEDAAWSDAAERIKGEKS